MAITVNWSEKCGEATFRQTVDGEEKIYTLDLYVGNAFLVMIDDNGEERNLACFFIDAFHMERCLKDGMFQGWDTLTAITINKAKCRNYKKIVALLAEYMDDIDISVYKDGNYTWHEFPQPRRTLSDIRMREIAEQAVSCLYNEETIEDLVNEIDLTPEEMDYFGIDIEEDDDYDE